MEEANELNKERNTSQLSRQLCCTMERMCPGPSPGGNDSRVYVLGGRTPRKDLQGKVTLPWRIRTSKEKDNTPLQPRRWDGASSLAAWVVASQHPRPQSMEHIL